MRSLERLYTAAKPAVSNRPPPAPGDIADLPLFRVPWTVLPGVTQVVLVNGPEWVHMFEELERSTAAGGGPARFGHLQGDGKGVALSARPMLPGSSSPTVGVLMELKEVRRLSDGRLSVVAHAFSRFRVVRPTESAPYPRADVSLLADDEELGLTGLRREVATKAPGTMLPRQARAAAARAAAAAAACSWSSTCAARSRERTFDSRFSASVAASYPSSNELAARSSRGRAAIRSVIRCASSVASAGSAHAS